MTASSQGGFVTTDMFVYVAIGLHLASPRDSICDCATSVHPTAPRIGIAKKSVLGASDSVRCKERLYGESSPISRARQEMWAMELAQVTKRLEMQPLQGVGNTPLLIWIQIAAPSSGEVASRLSAAFPDALPVASAQLSAEAQPDVPRAYEPVA
jgi:hypothetical protein